MCAEQKTQMAAALMGRTVAANNCGYWQFTHSGVTYDFVSGFFLPLSESIYTMHGSILTATVLSFVTMCQFSV